MTQTRDGRFAAAIAQVDAANGLDPNRETVAGSPRPKELVYAERMSAMLARFVPDASEALKLAARCQHIERWKTPRSDYPQTRAGISSGAQRCATSTPTVQAEFCATSATTTRRLPASAR